MHKIITISREFGSGGRELGKRLAEELGIPCYDHQIIEMIAKENGFDERYVANVSEKSIEPPYPMTIGHRFAMPSMEIMEQPIRGGGGPAPDHREFRQAGGLRHHRPLRRCDPEGLSPPEPVYLRRHGGQGGALHPPGSGGGASDPQRDRADDQAGG